MDAGTGSPLKDSAKVEVTNQPMPGARPPPEES
jgi:hypothetical protein